MKKLMCAFLIIAVTTSAHAGSWADSDFKEPTYGCALGGGAMYMMSKGDQSAKMQGFAIGCIVTGLSAYLFMNYAEEKTGRVLRADNIKLQETIKQMQYQNTTDNELGLDNTPLTRRKFIPAQKNPDGSWRKATWEYDLNEPGMDMVIGD